MTNITLQDVDTSGFIASREIVEQVKQGTVNIIESMSNLDESQKKHALRWSTGTKQDLEYLLGKSEITRYDTMTLFRSSIIFLRDVPPMIEYYKNHPDNEE